MRKALPVVSESRRMAGNCMEPEVSRKSTCVFVCLFSLLLLLFFVVVVVVRQEMDFELVVFVRTVRRVRWVRLALLGPNKRGQQYALLLRCCPDRNPD